MTREQSLLDALDQIKNCLRGIEDEDMTTAEKKIWQIIMLEQRLRGRKQVTIGGVTFKRKTVETA